MNDRQVSKVDHLKRLCCAQGDFHFLLSMCRLLNQSHRPFLRFCKTLTPKPRRILEAYVLRSRHLQAGITRKLYSSSTVRVGTHTRMLCRIIPHVFGRNRPTIIDDMGILKKVRPSKTLCLLNSLTTGTRNSSLSTLWETWYVVHCPTYGAASHIFEQEVASKLISATVGKDENGNPLNPLDSHFRSLNLTRMDPVSKASQEWDSLKLYVKETHGETHHMSVEVQQAFRVERQEETDAWMKAGNDKLDDGQRLLLWHGSRTTNFAGILKQGLRIAPPEGTAI